MIIGEIKNSAECRIDELNQNLPIFEIKLWFFRFQIFRFPKFYNFENYRISILEKLKKNNQISEIVEFQKLENFQNLTIFKTIKIPRIANLMVNHHISARTVRTEVNMRNNFFF